MSVVALSEIILRNPLYHATPLQREECRQLAEADTCGDTAEVERLTKQVEGHFAQLNQSFTFFVASQVDRNEVANCMINSIWNDYAAPEDRQSNSRTFILSYGAAEHQDQALKLKRQSFESIEELESWRDDMADHTFPEFCLDHKYAINRLRANCKGARLVNELVATCEWDDLIALLEHDEQACRNLFPWMVQSGRFFDSWFPQALSIILTQIKRYKTIAENRPSSPDLPPAYSENDPNAPARISTSLMSMVGLDQVANNVRNTLGWAR